MAKKRDAYYFENFSACAQYACDAAHLLDEIMNHFNQAELYDYLKKMHTIEHTADKKKHELLNVLIKAFITPIDREDIIQVSQNIDEITDKIEDVLIRIYCNHVEHIREDSLELVKIVCKCCDEVLELMNCFADYKHSKKVKEHIININTCEEEADKLYIKCMYNLHDSSNDVVEMISWREIYTYLEKCADTAEQIADIVESVIMKNS